MSEVVLVTGASGGIGAASVCAVERGALGGERAHGVHVGLVRAVTGGKASCHLDANVDRD